ncbi:hypothetical protein [Stenomitos frigidus]|uniref:hypothetical protein n=1 Tax=Stenomitos frigidus TaxID=1886765 RepID=UPI0011B2653F|nr:hypothetical protein [Stenomitos frigidus]
MTHQPDNHSLEFKDEMLPEYDLIKFRGTHGKHTEAMRQGYSVTIHHEDGASTTSDISPSNPVVI